MKQSLIEHKTKALMLLLPEHTVDNTLKHPTCFIKTPLTFRKGKYWKPCTSELSRMKSALDKLSVKYEQINALGMKVKAKRMLKKAMQISKRISQLLKPGGNLIGT